MTRPFAQVAAVLAALFLLAGAAQAASFRTEAGNEAAVRAISARLRCPVCQSENILDSQSGTAREMVEIVREQVSQGRSEAEIVAYFRDRYGDYVMLSPPASGFGALVWATPLLLLLIGGATYLVLLRRNARAFSAEAGEAGGRAPLTEERLEGLEL